MAIRLAVNNIHAGIGNGDNNKPARGNPWVTSRDSIVGNSQERLTPELSTTFESPVYRAHQTSYRIIQPEVTIEQNP